MASSAETVRELIKQELPVLIQDDLELQRLILDLSRQRFADKQQTEDRFDKILAEMQRNREEQARKWDEQNRKWDENQKTLENQWQETLKLIGKVDRHIGAMGRVGDFPARPRFAPRWPAFWRIVSTCRCSMSMSSTMKAWYLAGRIRWNWMLSSKTVC
jgi:hypothetical protein